MNRAIKIVALLAVFQLSCNHKQAHLSATEYIAYVENADNLMNVVIKSGDWIYKIQYKPHNYIALKEQSAEHLDGKVLVERGKKMEHTVWFNVSLGTTKGTTDPLKYETKDANEYNARLTYFLSRAAANFHLKYGNQSEMPQAAYYFENNYSIKPEVTAIIAFEIPDAQPKEDLMLEYDDGLFNSGIIKAKFESKIISGIPELKIN